MSTTLAGAMFGQMSFAYAKPATGLNDLGVQVTDSKRMQFTTGTATANKANRIYGDVISIAAGANTTVNLQALTDQLNLSCNFARIKGVYFHLISEADNADIGTNATSILFGGNGASNQGISGNATYGFFGNGNDTMRVFNGGFAMMGTPSAAGVLIDSTHKNVFILNEDGAVTAKVYVGFLGADA